MVGSWRQNSPLGVGYENSAQEPTYRALNPASGDSSQQEPCSQSANYEQTLRIRPISPTQSTRPQRCTASTAARIRTAKYEAAQRLAAIEMLKLEIEAELVQKKLEADIAILRCHSNEGTNTNFNMEDKLAHTDPTQNEPIYDRPLTCGRNEPVASRTELGCVINGTTRRATIINEDDERVLCFSAGSCTKSARHEIDGLAHSIEPEPMSVTDVRTFHVTIQTEEAAQLELPRYCNTRGAPQHQSYENCFLRPSRKLEFTNESEPANRSLSVLGNTFKRSLKYARFTECISESDFRTLVIHAKQASYKSASQQRGLVTMESAYLYWKKKRHKETGGSGFYRTIKTLAVLTKIKKLRESFAEGRMLRTGASCHATRRQ